MKKKQKYNLVLFIAVIGIWGTIAYRIIGYVSSPETTAQRDHIENTFVLPEKKEFKPYKLLPVNSDPFLGKLSSNNKIQVVKKQQINWPSIVYKGLISKGTPKKKIFILTINGNEVLLKKTETYENVTVVRGNKNSIVLMYNGHKKTVDIL